MEKKAILVNPLKSSIRGKPRNHVPPSLPCVRLFIQTYINPHNTVAMSGVVNER